MDAFVAAFAADNSVAASVSDVGHVPAVASVSIVDDIYCFLCWC